MWRFVVTHFKFTKRLEDLAESYLRRALDVPEGHDIPPVRAYLLLLVFTSALTSAYRYGLVHHYPREERRLRGLVRRHLARPVLPAALRVRTACVRGAEGTASQARRGSHEGDHDGQRAGPQLVGLGVRARLAQGRPRQRAHGRAVREMVRASRSSGHVLLTCTGMPCVGTPLSWMPSFNRGGLASWARTGRRSRRSHGGEWPNGTMAQCGQ